MSRVVFSAAAYNDLAAIVDYTKATWGRGQAESYLSEMKVRLDALAETPLIGRARPELATDLLSFPIEKHIAYYRVTSAGIAVVRILHHRQDPVRHLV